MSWRNILVTLFTGFFLSVKSLFWPTIGYFLCYFNRVLRVLRVRISFGSVAPCRFNSFRIMAELHIEGQIIVIFFCGPDLQSGNPLKIFKGFPNDFQTRFLKIYKDFWRIFNDFEWFTSLMICKDFQRFPKGFPTGLSLEFKNFKN